MLITVCHNSHKHSQSLLTITGIPNRFAHVSFVSSSCRRRTPFLNWFPWKNFFPSQQPRAPLSKLTKLKAWTAKLKSNTLATYFIIINVIIIIVLIIIHYFEKKDPILEQAWNKNVISLLPTLHKAQTDCYIIFYCALLSTVISN